MLVLALESSTSSAKAIVYDSEKGMIREKQEAYSREISHDGKSDPVEVFNLMMHVGSLAAAGYDIRAVALCGIWQSICICDDRFHPQSPCYAWNFVEMSPFCEKIREDEKLTEGLYQRTGGMVNCTYSRFVLPYLRAKGEDFTGKRFLSQGGYNYFRMTGEALESACSQSGAGFVSLETKEYDDFVMDFCGVRKEQFGALASYENSFPLKEEIAGLLHIPAGIPVVPSYADGALNQVGNDANRTGIMTISVGTSAALRMITEKPKLPKDRRLWCYLGVGNKYVEGGAISGACNCINWYKEDILGNAWSFEKLEEETGHPLPQFLPFLYGERCPGWQDERTAAFTGIRHYHRPPDFYHAIQMGITCNMYQCYRDLVENVAEPTDIIVSGGITHSVSWCHMLADILGKKILVSGNSSASTIGGAVLAMHAAGCFSDVSDFRTEFENAQLMEPDPDKAEGYLRAYEKYLQLYMQQS
jgi:gluconokinase